jgi:hypothetical protein
MSYFWSFSLSTSSFDITDLVGFLAEVDLFEAASSKLFKLPWTAIFLACERDLTSGFTSL